MSLALSSIDAFAAALANGRDVALAAYTLAPTGRVARALEAAADRGAHVAVRLDGHPAFGGDTADADAVGPIVRDLTAHGIAVTTSGPNDPPQHLKVAAVDGRAYLDDRNWASSGRQTIVCDDDARDVAAVTRAIAGGEASGAGSPTGSATLALEKRAALALERDAILDAPGDRIDVATESFGGSAISAALAARARAGDHVRLEVNARDLAGDRSGRERTTLAHLVALGVEVRAVGGDEKFAVLGDRAWLGSANATFTPGPMSDWGATTRDPTICAALATAFERAWASGSVVD